MNTYEQNVDELETLVLTQGFEFFILDGNEKWVVDVAIGALAKHGKHVTVFDIMKAEELDGYHDSAIVYAMHVMHPHWFDLNSIVNSDRNILLGKPADTAGWKARYNYDVAQFLINRGTVVQLQENVFAWEDFMWKSDNPDNPVVAVLNIKEHSWSEFTQTDMDPDYKTGVSAEVLFQDGQNRLIRHEGSFTEIMQAITSK
jgi:hypothetical protein